MFPHHFLNDVGLGYLSLGRSAESLSGGELQRVKLAASLGAGLTGVCYVLDEPSVGLHPSDTERLIESLGKLRDRGNTVVVVEHDHEIMKAADWIIDFGPTAGSTVVDFWLRHLPPSWSNLRLTQSIRIGNRSLFVRSDFFHRSHAIGLLRTIRLRSEFTISIYTTCMACRVNCL